MLLARCDPVTRVTIYSAVSSTQMAPPMVMFLHLVTILLGLAALTHGARQIRKSDIQARQLEAAKRWRSVPQPTVGTNVERRAGVHNITFSNPKASSTLLSPI